MEKKYLFSCSSFYKLSSSSKGTFLSANDCHISIISCYFESVSSTSFPGVIYCTSTTIDIEKSSFLLCCAKGGNMKYGRICLLSYCTVTFNHFSSELCGNQLSDQGDSTVYCEYGPLSVSYINSSFCSGSPHGSGSISTWYGTANNSIIFLNVISCVELCCLEFCYSMEKVQHFVILLILSIQQNAVQY